MAKKHQQREHISVRKKREEEQKLARRRAFCQQHKKQLIAGAVALCAAIVLIWLAVDFFYTPGGSMRMFLGNLMGVEETDVIRNLGSSKSPRYFKFGTFDGPEGYTLDPDYTLSTNSDTREQSFYYTADEESRAIRNVYVTGVKEKTGAEMMETVAGSGMYATVGEVRTAEIAGLPVTYLYAQANPSSEDTSIYHALLILYVDTLENSSILVNCTSAQGALDQLPAEEAMAAELPDILAGLKVFPE